MSEEQQIRCPCCHRLLSSSAFYKCKTRKNGRSTYCKDCANRKVNSWVDRNREDWNAYVRGRKRGQVTV